MSPEDLMTTWVEHRDAAIVLGVEGEVDASTSGSLVAAIVEVLVDGPVALVIDLSAVKFLGSAGLQVLHQTASKLRERAYFAVVCSSPATLRPIRLTGMDSVFDVHRTVDDAVRGLSTTSE